MTRTRTINQMRKYPFLVVALMLLSVQACSPAPQGTSLPGPVSATNTPETFHYSDEEVEAWLQQHAFLSPGGHGTPPAGDPLERLGIKLDRLDSVEHSVGGCTDRVRYDLSPGYWLFIDNNACFGIRVWVERKAASD